MFDMTHQTIEHKSHESVCLANNNNSASSILSLFSSYSLSHISLLFSSSLWVLLTFFSFFFLNFESVAWYARNRNVCYFLMYHQKRNIHTSEIKADFSM